MIATDQARIDAQALKEAPKKNGDYPAYQAGAAAYLEAAVDAADRAYRVRNLSCIKEPLVSANDLEAQMLPIDFDVYSEPRAYARVDSVTDYLLAEQLLGPNDDHGETYRKTMATMKKSHQSTSF